MSMSMSMSMSCLVLSCLVLFCFNSSLGNQWLVFVCCRKHGSLKGKAWLEWHWTKIVWRAPMNYFARQKCTVLYSVQDWFVCCIVNFQPSDHMIICIANLEIMKRIHFCKCPRWFCYVNVKTSEMIHDLYCLFQHSKYWVVFCIIMWFSIVLSISWT